jgi:DNA adenine methylase
MGNGMTVSRPVLRYFGGKFLLAPWIISNMPEHRVYVEPFGGAGSVLMQKPRAYAEIYNDIDDRIVNVFRVLQNTVSANILRKKLALTPFSRKEFELSSEDDDESPVESARRTIIRSFMGFGADSVCEPSRATGFRSNSNRSGTTPAHDWVNYVDAVPAFIERLQGVVIESIDAFDALRKFDTAETLFYVDPPYVTDTRKRKKAYRYEMTQEANDALLDNLLSIKGMVMLSGYEHGSYEKLRWPCITRKAYADGANERTECLWLNPAAAKFQKQQSLFQEVSAT